MSTVSDRMKALVIQGKGSAIIQEAPVPSVDADEILVRNIAVAQNPTDWQYIDVVGNPGTISGCDFAGIVVKVGGAVPPAAIALGDRVAGFTQGGTYADRGAYAEYAKAAAELVWKIPEDSISYEQAATMGCSFYVTGFWTAVQALFHPTRLGLVEPPEKTTEDRWVFIYAGSTSVGMFAIQLVHLAGYKVVTVASPRNWDLCKSLGADAVFDYKDPEAISKIKHVTGDSVHDALDTISQEQTQLLSVKVFGPGKSKLVVIMDPKEAAVNFRKDVEVQHVLIYTALGRSFTLRKYYEASPEDRAHMAAFLRKVPGLVSSGAIKPNPIRLWDGGLESVIDGLQYMREGKNKAEKIVYRLAKD